MRYWMIVTSTLLFFSFPASPQQRWEKTYGRPGAYDYGCSVQQTWDGGYIVGGGTTPGMWADVYFIKTSATGDTLWTRTYGTAGGFEMVHSVQQTSDSGYIAVGWTDSYSGNFDVYLIKTNASGDTLWTRTYGGSQWDDGQTVRQTSDGGYIIAGYTGSYGAGGGDVWLIKTDAQGDTLWTRTYGGPGEDVGYSVRQTQDGGYIVGGYTSSFGAGACDIWLIKTNASGDTLWTRTYGGMNRDFCFSVQQTSDSGYIAAGWTDSYGAAPALVYLIKTNAQGDTLWTRTYGASGEWNEGEYVQQTQEGGYIVVGGTTAAQGGDWHVYLIKTNAQGDTLWSRTYAQGSPPYAYGYSVQQTQDGGYIISGESGETGTGGRDVYLIKTDAQGSSGIEEERGQGLALSVAKGLTATPNPFVSFATIPGHEREPFDLYDISGRRVGTYRGDRIGEGLAPGVYFIKPENATGRPVRIVKLR